MFDGFEGDSFFLKKMTKKKIKKKFKMNKTLGFRIKTFFFIIININLGGTKKKKKKGMKQDSLSEINYCDLKDIPPLISLATSDTDPGAWGTKTVAFLEDAPRSFRVSN